MYSLRLISAALGLMLLSSGVHAASPEPIAFRNVAVVPMDREAVLPDQTVIVRDGRISALGPAAATPIPRGARVIDGRGKTLTPGLVDFHVHPGGPEELIGYLRAGVTTIAAFEGEFSDWRRYWPAIPADLPSPRRLTAGSAFDGRAPASPRFLTIGAAADAQAMVDRELADGADMIKTYGRITLPEFKAVARAARARRAPLVGHLPADVTLSDALYGGLDAVAHSEEFLAVMGRRPTDTAMNLAVSVTAKSGVTVIPNLFAYYGMLDHAIRIEKVMADPRVAALPPAVYHSYLPTNNEYGPAWRSDLPRFIADIETTLPVLIELTRRLHTAGVPLIAGTDAPIMGFPGDSLHDELALLKRAGLSNYEVLRAAGVNASDFLRRTSAAHASDRFGVIAPGARADLLLIEGDPLTDLAALKRLSGVMVGGVWRTTAQIDAAQAALMPSLRASHALVDEYERLHKAGDTAAVIAFLDRAPRGYPLLEDETIMLHADGLAAQGKVREAAELLEHAQPVVAHPMGLLKIAGLMRMRAGDWDQAEALFKRALQLNPYDAVAKDNLRLPAARRNESPRH